MIESSGVFWMLYHTQYIWSIVILKSTIFISAIKMLVNKLRLHLLRLRFHVKISTCEILPHSHKIQLWCKTFQCHSEKHFFLVYKSLNVRKIRWHLEQKSERTLQFSRCLHLPTFFQPMISVFGWCFFGISEKPSQSYIDVMD